MLAAARLLREKAAEHRMTPMFLKDLKSFSFTMQADDEMIAKWGITRAQHKEVLATAFQKLKADQ